MMEETDPKAGILLGLALGVVEGLRRGACWCDARPGEEHAQQCENARRYVKALREYLEAGE